MLCRSTNRATHPPRGGGGLIWAPRLLQLHSTRLPDTRTAVYTGPAIDSRKRPLRYIASKLSATYFRDAFSRPSLPPSSSRDMLDVLRFQESSLMIAPRTETRKSRTFQFATLRAWHFNARQIIRKWRYICFNFNKGDYVDVRSGIFDRTFKWSIYLFIGGVWNEIARHRWP